MNDSARLFILINNAAARRADDGLIDVVTSCRISRAGIVRELTRIHRGRHLANPRVQIMRGARVRVEAVASSDKLKVEADGDVRGSTPLEFRIMPRASARSYLIKKCWAEIER